MKKIFLLIFAIILGNATFAQRHEIGLFLGMSYYNGDLNPGIPFLMAQPAGGLAYRYNINPRWAFKFNGYYGYLEGNDKNNPDIGLRSRNLYFKSIILEFAGTAEFNFMRFVPGSDRERFTPFLFAGFSVFRFNPQAQFNGEWYNLQPLCTEGQGTTAYPDRHPYSLTSFGIPFGLGVKFSVGESVVMGFEWGMRKTFTDYIDDVSKSYASPDVLRSEKGTASMIFGNRKYEGDIFTQGLFISLDPNFYNEEDMNIYEGWLAQDAGQQRGIDSNKDWYSFIGFTFTFKIKGPRIKKCDAYRDHYYYKEYRLGR